MTWAERIPTMSDEDLRALHDNALRLSVGDGARNRVAARLLPSLRDEISARKARLAEAKAAATAERRLTRRH